MSMTPPVEPSGVGRGFSNLVLDAQSSFREILWAMARPGEIRRFDAAIEAPVGLDPASAVLLLTLADGDTTVWLPELLRDGEAGSYVRFHCGAPLATEPSEASLAVLDSRREEPTLLDFHHGVDCYPDRSATVVIQIDQLRNGAPVRLTGPGIRGERDISPIGLPERFWDVWARNHAGFPLGVDVILASGRSILGLPRSVAACSARREAAPCT